MEQPVRVSTGPRTSAPRGRGACVVAHLGSANLGLKGLLEYSSCEHDLFDYDAKVHLRRPLENSSKKQAAPVLRFMQTLDFLRDVSVSTRAVEGLNNRTHVNFTRRAPQERACSSRAGTGCAHTPSAFTPWRRGRRRRTQTHRDTLGRASS